MHNVMCYHVQSELRKIENTHSLKLDWNTMLVQNGCLEIHIRKSFVENKSSWTLAAMFPRIYTYIYIYWWFCLHPFWAGWNPSSDLMFVAFSRFLLDRTIGDLHISPPGSCWGQKCLQLACGCRTVSHPYPFCWRLCTPAGGNSEGFPECPNPENGQTTSFRLKWQGLCVIPFASL